jgi:hypothetical protein
MLRVLGCILLALGLLSSCARSAAKRKVRGDDGGVDAGVSGDAAVPGPDAGHGQARDAGHQTSDAGGDGSVQPRGQAGYTLFEAASAHVDLSSSLLANPGFEGGVQGTLTDWQKSDGIFSVDESGGRNGSRALRLDDGGTSVGAMSTIHFNQPSDKPLYFSGWSRASAVSGASDGDYSVWLDIQYQDGTWLYGAALPFATGSHDYQHLDRVIVPAKPVSLINVYCLLRGNHSGSVWFDDIIVRQAPDDVQTFDGELVVPAALPTLAQDVHTVASSDGLALDLTGAGATSAIRLHGKDITESDRAASGGFFVRDVSADSAWVHAGGALSESNGLVSQVGTVPGLELELRAAFTPKSDRIDVHAELVSAQAKDRAVTLYFALPLVRGGWLWGDDIRHERNVIGDAEFSNVSYEHEIGATGSLSRYPWGAAYNTTGGIVIALGLAAPRVARIVMNPSTLQLYIAFDLGLTPDTHGFPNKAWVDFTLYPIKGSWGFRAATDGYHARYPRPYFDRQKVPQGIWMPFTKLTTVASPLDFGFAVHELSTLADAADDKLLGIASFRYLSEPWSHWLPIHAANLDPRNPDNYPALVNYLKQLRSSGSDDEKRKAEATLSSGFYDGKGSFVYVPHGPGEVPWCNGTSGCALFAVNADPQVSDPTYKLNKANLEWNAQAQQDGTNAGLSGEYIDSVQGNPFRMQLDQRRSHFNTVSEPVTFAGAARELGIPSLFATSAYLHWLGKQVHDEGRLLMGNTMLEDLPFAADVFDYMGVETNWISGDSFVPDSDAHLNYRRSLSGQAPYGFLMNTNFDAMGTDSRVERYMQICAFYGIYPSFFSPDAANSPYWENSTWYERDRAMFIKYVPLIRTLNKAGWEPLTFARTSNASVYIERYGRWPDVYLALRNLGAAVDVQVTFDAELGLPAQDLVAKPLIVSSSDLSIPGQGTRAVTVHVGAQASEVLYVGP